MQRREVAEEPTFKDETGAFSQTRFLSVLANAGLSEADYLQRIESALRREQIVGAVAGGVRQPESWRVPLPHTSWNASLHDLPALRSTPTRLLSLTKRLWPTGTMRSKAATTPRCSAPRVGSLTPEMFASAITISETDIADAYADRIDEFTTPERRRVRQWYSRTRQLQTRHVTVLPAAGNSRPLQPYARMDRR